MWSHVGVMLLAVAAGAIVAGLVAFVRPGLAGRIPPVLVPVAAVGGAVALAFADTAPTGWTGFDLVLRAGFGALVALAAARAGTVATTWLAVVAVVVAFIAEAPAGAITGVSAGAFFALAAAGDARAPARAVAAAAVLGPLAYTDWQLATGASAAGVAVAALPVLVVGLARTSSPTRGRIVAVAALGVVVLAIGTVAAGVAALDAKDDIDAAVDLATAGIDQLGDDDDAARQSLRSAAARFDAAEDSLRAPWARPALLVPGVAQQSRAVSTMASAGAELARTAADASDEADIDSIRPRDGKVDLDALMALQEPLDRSLASLRRASARLDDVGGPLLVTPVADRLIDLRTEVDDALGSAELASQAVEVAPGLLGADGPRQFFLSFQTPSEIRGNGGFMGNWAELTTDDGLLTLTRSGRLRELIDAGAAGGGLTVDDDSEFVQVYGEAAASWGVVNFSPDNPTVSQLITELYPQSGGTVVDGVITVTPKAFAALLELTGPVQVEDYPEALTSENAERILLHEQYLEFPQAATDDRVDFLADSVEVLFRELTTGDLPGPSALAAELGPAVASRDLQLWSADPDEQALFETMGATGDVSRTDVDSFGVVTQNYNGNKIDWFLHRTVAYDTEWNPETGSVAGSLTVTIENEAPAVGLPTSIIGWGGDVSAGQVPVADGENLMLVTLYGTFPFEGVTVEGEPVDFTRHTELGHDTVRFYLAVPPEGVREVAAEFTGTVDPGRRYVLRPLRQPTVNPDRFDIQLSLPPGWEMDVADAETPQNPGDLAVEATAAERILIDVAASPARSRSSSTLDRLRGVG